MNMTSLSLVLLPAWPATISFSAFSEVYRNILSRALDDASSRSTADNHEILDIALCSPIAFTTNQYRRGNFYERSQRVIGILYRIMTCLCAEKSIDLQHRNLVEVRIFIIVDDCGEHGMASTNQEATSDGPVVSIANLASSPRRWKRIYFVEIAGEAIVSQFTKSSKDTQSKSNNLEVEIIKVTGPREIPTTPQHSVQPTFPESSQSCYNSLAVGGTFDHLHAGHKLLLTAAALLLEPTTVHDPWRERCITIGISGDELLKTKQYVEVMESWDERQDAVYRFLSGIMDFGIEKPEEAVRTVREDHSGKSGGKTVRYVLQSGLVIKCVEISDPFGPTITDESINALVVSGETRSGGNAVNEKRRAQHWPSLDVFEVDVLDADSDDVSLDVANDFAGKISSTDIRRQLHQLQQ